MVTFKELLLQKKGAIVQMWLDAALATYSEKASTTFQRQEDPFANPVGHSLRAGTLAIFEALLEDANAERIRDPLLKIIKVRAVQEFPASEALSFILRLKEAVRRQLGSSLEDARIRAASVEFDGKIDQVMLAAIDLYVQCRAQVAELRVNEVKRKVSWVVDKLNQRGSDREPVGMDLA